MGRIRLPGFAETIRFRLSLAFALVVFAVGAAAITGVFIYENSTLVEPVIMAEKKIVRDTDTGELTEVAVIFPEESQRVMAEKVELDAYRRALNSLRTSSFLALGVIFLAAFSSGWFLSGDLGRFDENGNLAITGRMKDIIIRGGYNIHPAKIEDLAVEHSQVANCLL